MDLGLAKHTLSVHHLLEASKKALQGLAIT